MYYNLKIKEKNERGFWSTGIQADLEEEAIEKSKEYLNQHDEVEYVILEKEIIHWKKIIKLEKEE